MMAIGYSASRCISPIFRSEDSGLFYYTIRMFVVFYHFLPVTTVKTEKRDRLQVSTNLYNLNKKI